MTLKERFLAKDSKLGILLKSWVAYFLLLCAATGSLLEYLGTIPDDLVPKWIKVSVIFASIISRIAGKMTVHKDEANEVN